MLVYRFLTVTYSGCWIVFPYCVMTSSLYTTVGQNNRNALVQCKRLAPYNEDLSWKQGFDQTSVAPGAWNRIRIDMKHAGDREIILNDVRLRFRLNLQTPSRTNVGNVYCVRGTDLIRELRVKINEDTVFHSSDKHELTHLWLMNNHKLSAESHDVRHSYLGNHGVIPRGFSPGFFYHPKQHSYYSHRLTNVVNPVYRYVDGVNVTIDEVTQNGMECHDGLPRLIYSDANGTGTTPSTDPYMFHFDISMNQLIGPVFTRLHQRRIEYVQIEVRFQPWVDAADAQDFLLFENDPTKLVIRPAFNSALGAEYVQEPDFASATHPYSLARYDKMEIVMFRSTFLDGVDGLTSPSTRMLSFLMHRYSHRDYTIDLSQPGSVLNIPLKDFELRSNITRMYWMLDTKQMKPAERVNHFSPLGEPCKGYEQLYGVEILWKNDKVLDLDTFFKVYRHYVLAENKRHGISDPHIRFQRLCPRAKGLRTRMVKENRLTYYQWDNDHRPIPSEDMHNTQEKSTSFNYWLNGYEYPVYFVDFQMNITTGAPGAEIIQGLINDTNDYIIRIKRVLPSGDEPAPPAFENASLTNAKVHVFIEYQTLVNLAANSNQFNRASQVITRQLNVQN